ncbi:hypothetical protein DPMN_125089 [Dreissena polymorpha]|uniref:Uncharacterized protein n=1 Tax=Dreissena polymorpha TaxID=45954 RepID=A0A9D4GX66_DREPO|nr:hypothetical protein DPMN_125089 [Dreissena polymorpha]
MAHPCQAQLCAYGYYRDRMNGYDLDSTVRVRLLQGPDERLRLRLDCARTATTGTE